jgi:hypothetical protein
MGFQIYAIALLYKFCVPSYQLSVIKEIVWIFIRWVLILVEVLTPSAGGGLTAVMYFIEH